MVMSAPRLRGLKVNFVTIIVIALSAPLVRGLKINCKILFIRRWVRPACVGVKVYHRRVKELPLSPPRTSGG
jgi:hypothetical protein